MERELLLAIKAGKNRTAIENELELMKDILPIVESVNVFYKTNDVFDIKRNKKISSFKKIKKYFSNNSAFSYQYLVISKN